MRNKPEDFIGMQGRQPQKEDTYSSTDCDILPEIWGLPWCDITMKKVLAMDPSFIRVTHGEVTCDARHLRITVYVDKNNLITRVEQERRLPVEPGFKDNGWLLDMQLTALREGRPLPTETPKGPFYVKVDERYAMEVVNLAAPEIELDITTEYWESNED